MKKLFLICVSIALLVFCLALTSAAKDELKNAPLLMLPDVSGNFFILSEQVGRGADDPKPVVIDFFTTWREPCKREIEILEGIKQKFGYGIVLKMVNIEPYEKSDRVTALDARA